MEPRFVILVHTGHGQQHWDFMLEHAGALATWRLPQSPESILPGVQLDAIRLPDHGIAYLEYEGPVSKARGRVDSLDAGTYTLLHQDETRWQFDLHGLRLTGRFELRREPACPEPVEGVEPAMRNAGIWRLRRIND